MKLIAMAMFATTALVPAAAYAQGQEGQDRAPGMQGQMNQAQMNQGQMSQGQTNQGRSQLRPIAVSQLKGETLYSQRGQEIGEIERVILGQGNQGQADQAYLVVAFGEFLGMGGEQRMVPLAQVAYRGDRLIVQGMGDNQFRRLQSYRANMAGFEEAEDDAEARIVVLAAGQPNQQQQMAQGQRMQGQDGTDVVVRQPAPTVRVDPADPRVVVRQPQPRVTVSQGQPEILVRQPQPTVRVDIPQPEIIVRMPEPDVNVAMAQPQVQVTQPRPEVQVRQPGQPQVEVERAQPQVMVQRQAGEQAQVQVQRQQGQPVVRYERAEPRVIVNQAEGQPTVRIERQQQQAQADGQQTRQQQTRQTARAQMTDQDREVVQQRRTAPGADPLATARERLGIGDVDTTAAVGTAATRALTVNQLQDMDVYNLRGEELGEIDRIIINPANNMRYAILEHGGFLGLGEDQVALPLERFWLRGDRLVLRGVTEEDLEAMPDWERRFANYRELGNNARTDLSVWE
jgi:sporulation protein YlmC with PRC-barrel domain